MAEYFNKFLSKNETTLYPWDIRIQDTKSVTIIPGLVAGILCTNYNNTFTVNLDSLDQTYYAKIILTTDGQNIVSGKIVIDTQIPKPQKIVKNGISDSIEILFGIINNRLTYNLYKSNILATIQRTFTIAKTSVNPGQPLYDIYYKLVF
jgi:hypothetical protein